MNDQKLEARLRVAEAMLEKYIRERRKPLAELALSTLLELAPNHPRRADYETWVTEIDREAAAHAELEDGLAAGRDALRAGDLTRTRRHLATLAKRDPHGAAYSVLARELAAAEQSASESQSVGSRRRRIDELLDAGRVGEANAEIEKLATLGVAKLTIDRLRRRSAEVRDLADRRGELAELGARFARHLDQGEWQQARDIAHDAGRVDAAGAATWFERVNRRETEHRRSESIDQGIATLERFIAQGRREEAELALKVLRGLDVDERQLQLLRQRIDRL